MSTLENAHHVAELAAKIESVGIAMFTTVDDDGHLISHPMTNQKTAKDGSMWFFTSTLTSLWENIAAHPEVNLSFANAEDRLFVSVSGRAERVVERERIQALWNPSLAVWFPHGVEDPHVVLVRVEPHGAEYWDANENKMVRLFELAKAALTGAPPELDPGVHGTIKL